VNNTIGLKGAMVRRHGTSDKVIANLCYIDIQVLTNSALVDLTVNQFNIGFLVPNASHNLSFIAFPFITGITEF
jgi:hypothetical protein